MELRNAGPVSFRKTQKLMLTNYYNAYGLDIKSDIVLSGMMPGVKGKVDVRIRYRDVPAAGSNNEWMVQVAPGQFVFTVEDVARYLILDGHEIWVEPAPGSDGHEIRNYLLGSVFGAILHQRRILAMHASTIQTDFGAVSFVGDAGMGKSTLLAAFVKRKYSMLADDVTGVRLDAEFRPLVFPAGSNLRLWADSASKLNRSVVGMQPVSPDFEKYYLPVDNFCRAPVALRAVYELTSSDSSRISVEGVSNKVKAFQTLAQHTYRAEFLDDLGQRRPHFKLVTSVADSVILRRVTRPLNSFLLDELVERLELDWQQLGLRSSPMPIGCRTN